VAANTDRFSSPSEQVAEKAAAEQAQYEAYQAPQAAPAAPVVESESMDVDAPAASSTAGQKRKADEELAEGEAKKSKPGSSPCILSATVRT
jgi:hypothetical protein